MKVKIIMVLILSIFIAGCQSQKANIKNIDDIKVETKNNNVTVVKKTSLSDNSIWVAAKEISNDDGEDFGWIYGVSGFSSQDPVPFKDVINYLQDNDNIRVTYTGEAIKRLGSDISGSGFILRYKGNFKELFDIITAQSGTFWKASMVDGQKVIHFYVFEEASFDIWAIHSLSKVQADQPDDTASGFSTTNLIETDVWKDLSIALKEMKSEEGSLTFSPSTGLVFVKDIPPVIGRMETLINTINEKINRQALIDVSVIEYKSNNNNSVLADITAAFSTVNRTVGTVTGPIGTVLGSGTLSAAIINANSKFNGSEVIMEALNSTGETGIKLQRSVIALNNTSVPFVIKSTQTFLESISGGALSNGTVGATTITPGKVDSSINLFLYPRILGNGRIIIQASIKIRSVDRIRQITSGTQTIEAPDTTDLFFEQTVSMKDGQTLILSGTGNAKYSTDNKIGIFGGSTVSQGENSKLVFIITPHIVQR